MLGQLATAALLLCGVLGLGLRGVTAADRRLALPAATRAALVLLVGIAVLGVSTFVLGQFGQLGAWWPVVFALAGGTAWLRRPVRAAGLDLAGRLGRTWRTHPWLASAFALTLAVGALGALAPPSHVDEVEYHWPAAEIWATFHGWVPVNLRHVNAFPFMEVVYTAAATQGSYVAAHLLHFATLVALALVAAGLARSLGLSGGLEVAVAAVAMRVVWDFAASAYNDTAVGAFLVAAVAVAVGGRFERRALVGASLMLVVATSIKPTAAVATGLLVLALVLARLDPELAPPQDGAVSRWRGIPSSIALLAGPVLATVVFWSVRQHAYTGWWIDPFLVAPPDEYVRTTLPTTAEQVVAPVMPFVLGVVGSPEPWGGRTSAVLQVLLLPALVYVLVYRGRVARRFALLALPAWANWVVLGLFIVRTRFHIVSWVLLVVACRVVLEDAARRWPAWSGRLEAVWSVLLAVGMVDVGVSSVRAVAPLFAGS